MHFSSFDTLEPNDLSLLRRVLEDVCNERDITVAHPDAQPIARELVDWFLFGVKEPAKLKSMLKPIN